jgi:hypothetical protein
MMTRPKHGPAVARERFRGKADCQFGSRARGVAPSPNGVLDRLVTEVRIANGKLFGLTVKMAVPDQIWQAAPGWTSGVGLRAVGLR